MNFLDFSLCAAVDGSLFVRVVFSLLAIIVWAKLLLPWSTDPRPPTPVRVILCLLAGIVGICAAGLS